MFLMIHIIKEKEVLSMSKEIMWSYMKFLIANKLDDTIENFKRFKENLNV